jgi:hypothetical protein
MSKKNVFRCRLVIIICLINIQNTGQKWITDIKKSFFYIWIKSYHNTKHERKSGLWDALKDCKFEALAVKIKGRRRIACTKFRRSFAKIRKNNTESINFQIWRKNRQIKRNKQQQRETYILHCTAGTSQKDPAKYLGLVGRI